MAALMVIVTELPQMNCSNFRCQYMQGLDKFSKVKPDALSVLPGTVILTISYFNDSIPQVSG